MSIEWLEWPAPENVRACFSVRSGGVSGEPYDTFNMGDHVNDNSVAVNDNRQRLQQLTGAPNIAWLRQVHGTDVAHLPLSDVLANEYDACATQYAHQACCVMTADCLPVFFCDHQGSQVAIAHAGWRGLLGGVLQNTVSVFANSKEVIAYLGPAISQKAFEIGSEVREAFMQQDAAVKDFFVPSERDGHWFADLYGISRYTLASSGVAEIYGGDYCTYSEEERFFSYRRDGVTGRMANLIWLT